MTHEFIKWVVSLLPKETVQIQPLEHTFTTELSLLKHTPIPKERKPLWWYLGAFSLWCQLAKVACIGMESRLDIEVYKPDPSDTEAAPEPTGKDFMIAIFFIVLGILALVAGLISNIIVQM